MHGMTWRTMYTWPYLQIPELLFQPKLLQTMGLGVGLASL